MIKFDTDQMASLLKNRNCNKAQCPDEIYGRILKMCYSSLSKPLAVLFQLSYDAGTIPREWKLAGVVPVHERA